MLSEIGRNRLVWSDVLLAVQRDECMMPFTYQLNKMDMDALRHAACSPYRLSGAFLGKADGELISRVIELDCGRDGPPPQYAVTLLPGGRWFIHTDRGWNPQSGGLSRIVCSDMLPKHGTQPAASFDLANSSETWPTLYAVQSDLPNNRIVAVVSYILSYPT